MLRLIAAIADAGASTNRASPPHNFARMNRQCSRSGCAQAATSTLSYQYGRALVWLDDLTVSRDPHDYDLCERHTARLSVPNGWRLEDRRSRRVLIFAPASRLAG
jgi:hypothetical protein